ncbi:MAG: polyphenol oxidase family protein [Acidimicrobiales bacterium]|nr:polyphenol oxidase family protein [Acidimicrobiales bacterium]
MRARWVTSTKADGDFRVGLPADELAARRRAFVDLPWVWLRQVHGSAVVVVDADNWAAVCGTEADALVTASPGLALAVHTADCVPVVVSSPDGVIGVAHAGWRGLAAGVIDATVEAMEGLGTRRERLHIELGPHIGPECYEFGATELAAVEARIGTAAGLRARTAAGALALDLRAAVTAAARQAGVPVTALRSAPCTSCWSECYFSHRARGESGRMATVAWLS